MQIQLNINMHCSQRQEITKTRYVSNSTPDERDVALYTKKSKTQLMWKLTWIQLIKEADFCNRHTTTYIGEQSIITHLNKQNHKSYIFQEDTFTLDNGSMIFLPKQQDASKFQTKLKKIYLTKVTSEYSTMRVLWFQEGKQQVHQL